MVTIEAGCEVVGGRDSLVTGVWGSLLVYRHDGVIVGIDRE